MKGPYDDIINLPRHVSTKRPPMSNLDRAAQFAPFAALTGHEEAVKETARMTDRRLELGEHEKQALDQKLRIIVDQLEDFPQVSIKYFIPDSKKAGGQYVKVSGSVKKVDEYERLLIMSNDIKIPIEEIIEINGEIFSALP
ncbi:MAG: hypothetical protein ACOYEH_09240 [Caldicoprobacterales bacterium]|jgi:hypothetical protein